MSLSTADSTKGLVEGISTSDSKVVGLDPVCAPMDNLWKKLLFINNIMILQTVKKII